MAFQADRVQRWDHALNSAERTKIGERISGYGSG